jgi:hypothetical protein
MQETSRKHGRPCPRGRTEKPKSTILSIMSSLVIGLYGVLSANLAVRVLVS